MLYLLLSVVGIAGIAAFSGENSLRGAVKPALVPFVLHGHVYESQGHYIRSGKRCATKSVPQGDLSDINERLREIEKTIRRTVGILDINVYWHVIKSSTNAGAISSTDINAQIAVMNNDYRQSNVRFTLVSTTETVNDAWYDLSDGSSEEIAMKTALRVGTAADLNVYSIMNNEGILGWATFPMYAAGNLAYDGVVVDYRTLPGGTAAPYNLGATMTHEVGHWMGLYHTFQDGCVVSTSGGDEIADTPCELEPAYGCPTGRDSCPGTTGALAGLDPITNYMDYTDDSCMNNFTPDQTTRMKAMWAAYREQ